MKYYTECHPSASPQNAPITFRSDTQLKMSPEVAAILGLLPASVAGQSLHCEGASPGTIDRLERVVEIFHSWSPSLFNLIDINGSEASEDPRPVSGRGKAAFFSGGVDSFYTLLKNEPTIDAIILVIGFDVKSGDVQLRSQVSEMARKVGVDTGKRVIEVETNLREWSEPLVHWSWFHGAALAAVAHLLRGEFSEYLIASSYATDQLHPWGTHPELDHLWGNSSIRLVHDGCEARRVEKIRFIARSPVVLRHLRVCYENRSGAYNCGRCEKCLRTMVTLSALQVLEQCSTFPAAINRWQLRRLIVASEDAKIFVRENVGLLREMPSTPARRQLLDDLADVLSGRYSKGAWALARRLWWHVRYGPTLAPIRNLVLR